MRLSYKWLNEYVDLSDVTPNELAEKLTTAGLEVEGIEAMAEAEGLVIGEVVECEDVEGTHLHKTQTSVGDKTYQIICGAPNCRKGLKVIVALPGAKLPGGTIEAKPLHGLESNGMLCALFELGVDKKALREDQINGIEELPQDAPVGETDVLGYLGLDDTILDVSLTPNRADCSAMWNMAKEVGAILHKEVKWPDYANQADCGTETNFKVSTNTDKCSCYIGKVVNHVKVGPSPKWMQQYLNAAGMNSINNVVDISNFVMLETGQPLHYYNLKKLSHQEITVVDDRELQLTALDGATFDIQKGDLVITTNGEATGIAGIMGGEESMIDEDTDSIFIEAAHFDAASIRRTSIRLNLITEAAQRFTKGIEALAMLKAVDRSVQLLKEYADASGFEKTVQAGEVGYTPQTVVETLSHCNELLGTNFKMDEVVDTLKWLDFKPEVDGDAITCHIPSYRIDIDGKADIDEEVIRLLGFDSLVGTLPNVSATVGQRSHEQLVRKITREAMMAEGLNEIVTYTLVNEQYATNGFAPLDHPIALAMPMSEARKYTRTNLINSVLEVVQYNEARSNTNNAFYEISKVYGKDKEQERLAIVLDGNLIEDKLRHVEVKGDFYALKGIILNWLQRLGFTGSRIKVEPNTMDVEHFHPYRSALISLGNTKLGVFGELHPDYAKKYDCKRVAYAELFLDPIFEAKAGRIKFQELPKYPAVTRDLALVVDKEVTAQDLTRAITTAGVKNILANVEVFDVYEGEHVEAGKKSVALKLTYQTNHTLKDDEILEAHNKILKSLETKTKATLRA